MSKGFKVLLGLAVCCFVFLGFTHMANSGSNSQQVSAQSLPVTPTSTPEQKAKAAECWRGLQKVRAAWSNMRQDGDYVSVVASPAFQQLSYENRETFTTLAVCYYTDGRMDDTVRTVDFLDPYTNASFGHWYKGLELTFDR